MSPTSLPAAIATVALAGLLGAAVVSDLRARRIPNKLVLTGLVIAALVECFALLTTGSALAGERWWMPLGGFALGLAALMPLHLLRACGAGDVKLMAMVGAFVGPTTVLHATLATMLAGGVLSLVFMLGRGVASRTANNLRGMFTIWALNVMTRQGLAVPPTLQTTAARLPYAVAIAAGTAIALVWRMAGVAT